MRRHTISVPSSFQDVIDGLRAMGDVMVELTDTDQGLLHLAGGAGLVHHSDGATILDVLEFDEGPHVVCLVDGLRAAGFHVSHNEV